MLPVLTVSGPEGLLYLNGHFCGLCGKTSLPLSGDSAHFLQVFPFGTAAVLTLRLTLENDFLTDIFPQDACAVQWPGGWIALEIPESPPETEPRLLSSIEKDGETFLLVDEGELLSFGQRASEAAELFVSRAENVRLQPMGEQFRIQGDCSEGEFFALCASSSPPRVLCCVCGDTVSLHADGAVSLTRRHADFRRHICRQVWTPGENGVYVLSRQQVFPGEDAPFPCLPHEVALAFLESLSLDCPDEAAQYLADPAMLPVWKERIGPFDLLVPFEHSQTPQIPAVLQRLSPSVAHVRAPRFLFDEKNGKIAEVFI